MYVAHAAVGSWSACEYRVPLCRVPHSVWLLDATRLSEPQYLQLEIVTLIFWVNTFSNGYIKPWLLRG